MVKIWWLWSVFKKMTGLVIINNMKLTNLVVVVNVVNMAGEVMIVNVVNMAG